MAGHVTKAQLLRNRLPVDTVEIPGLGTVKVRGLSRAELLYELADVDRSVPGAFERKMVSLAMVAPQLSEDEVGAWQVGSRTGEIEDVTAKINQLSGLTKDSAKEAWKEFESNPDAEFRVPTGEGSGDDGGAAEG